MSTSMLRHSFPVMGTVCSIRVAATAVDRLGTEEVSRAVADAEQLLHQLEQRFSHYRADSDIERWARGEMVDDEARAAIEYVLLECGRLAADSGGVFAVRSPRSGRLDTAGYVKGYAIRRAVETLRAQGISDFVLGIGGDVHCEGSASDTQPWRIAVQDPRRSHAVVALLTARDAAIATSGRAQRGDHIWSGGTAATTSDLLSFTVTGPDVAEADAYATIGFAMGLPGIAWVARHEGYRSLAVRSDGTLVGDVDIVVPDPAPAA